MPRLGGVSDQLTFSADSAENHDSWWNCGQSAAGAQDISFFHLGADCRQRFGEVITLAELLLPEVAVDEDCAYTCPLQRRNTGRSCRSRRHSIPSSSTQRQIST